MNLFAGDNGLGKSFVLDVAAWTLSMFWSEFPAYPLNRATQPNPEIVSRLQQRGVEGESQMVAVFDWETYSWHPTTFSPPPPSLLVYARTDGSFLVWDPIRNFPPRVKPADLPELKERFHTWMNHKFAPEHGDPPYLFEFDEASIWSGLRSETKWTCRGLIQDWLSWQNSDAQTDEGEAYQILLEVLGDLSAPRERLLPGKPVRVLKSDQLNVPTIKFSYGETPITMCPAGVKRILSIAYMVIWSWIEHNKAAAVNEAEIASELILIIDELELHLHPKWQRKIMPALVSLTNRLSKKLALQLFLTTHSPLILASAEPIFEKGTDKFFLFDLDKDGKAFVQDRGWVAYGDVIGWLTSDIFQLKEARSEEAERIIGAAQAYMRGDKTQFSDLQTIDQIHNQLLQTLAADDEFWYEWLIDSGKR